MVDTFRYDDRWQSSLARLLRMGLTIADDAKFEQFLAAAEVRDRRLEEHLGAANTFSASTAPFKRNLLDNGKLAVAQRPASISTATGYKVADRWSFDDLSDGAWFNVVTFAPSAGGRMPDAEFRNVFSMQCSTADAVRAAGDYTRVTQAIEGVNLHPVRKGSALAQPLTLSFWVKAGVAGVYVAELEDVTNTRQVSLQYTISVAGVWEYKALTFPADLTGTWTATTDAALKVHLWMGAGSNFTSGTITGQWRATASANRGVGQLNLAATLSNSISWTGLQLECGTLATPFEHLPYPVDLAICQRYYWRYPLIGAAFNFDLAASALTTNHIMYPVTMRVAPTLSSSFLSTGDFSSIVWSQPTAHAGRLSFINTATPGTNRNHTFADASFIAASAEL